MEVGDERGVGRIFSGCCCVGVLQVRLLVARTRTEHLIKMRNLRPVVRADPADLLGRSLPRSCCECLGEIAVGTALERIFVFECVSNFRHWFVILANVDVNELS